MFLIRTLRGINLFLKKFKILIYSNFIINNTCTFFNYLQSKHSKIVPIFVTCRIGLISMRKISVAIIISISLFLGNNVLYAQAFNPYQHAYQGWDGNKIKKASPLRAFLNKFSLNVNAGYGMTFYSQEINSDVLEIGTQPTLDGADPKLVILSNYSVTGNSINFNGITNWLNAPQPDSGTYVLQPDGPANILYADIAKNKYKGHGFNIPINVSLHLDIDRFRIGGGIMYEIHRVKELRPAEQGEQPYIPNFNATTMFRYYFTAGAKVYHVKGWDYNVDLQIGKVKYGGQYDKSRFQNGIFFNLGLPFEYELSEYFYVVVRPSFDFKSYTTTTAGGGGATPTEGTSFQFNQPAFYLNFGVRMKLPEIKRCPVKSCKTQLKHVHGSREFRGQPFYKEQNPKIGELYPELIQEKNRRKNKKNRN